MFFQCVEKCSFKKRVFRAVWGHWPQHSIQCIITEGTVRYGANGRTRNFVPCALSCHCLHTQLGITEGHIAQTQNSALRHQRWSPPLPQTSNAKSPESLITKLLFTKIRVEPPMITLTATKTCHNQFLTPTTPTNIRAIVAKSRPTELVSTLVPLASNTCDENVWCAVHLNMSCVGLRWV